MGDRDDILNNASHGNDGRINLGKGDTSPGDDKLMAYLDGQLSPEEQHEIEQWMSDEGMESDAVDGLKMLEPADTRRTINRINHNLHKTLHQKKNKRRQAKPDATALVAIVVIILLIVVAYLVIKIIA